ncbi:tubulin-like doman-containing protein [Myxococcota bacterium]|nr:tubulin-like doman-containing protein [Myxococcota bacterium]
MTALITDEPTLIIGLGGAGGQTIARLAGLVEQAVGMLPPTMQLLWLDTDAFEALDPSARRALDPRGDFVGLLGFDPREWIESEFHGAEPPAEDVAEWYDPSARAFLPAEPVDARAAKLRLLGRIGLFRHRFEVEQLLRDKISAALAGTTELETRPPEGAPPSLKIVLVTSSVGGAGSGTFLDVLYMAKRLAIVDFQLAAEASAIIYLPEPFLRASQRASELELPLLQANAWAFFDELDHFLKHPTELNGYAMDARSADRRPHPVGTGLPAGVDVLDVAFLAGAELPGVGTFERLRDLYAHTARAIFQHELVPVSGSVASVLASAKRRLRDRDAQRGRPKRYAALGHAELTYPRNVFQAFLARRYEYEAIASGILRQSDELATKAKEDAGAYAQQIFDELIGPAMAELEKVKVKALEALPTEASFAIEGGGIDLARVDEGALGAELEDTLRSLERTVGALRIRFAAERERITAVLRDDVERRIDTGGEGLGLPYLLDFFATTDTHLEAEHARIIAGGRSPDAYAARFEDVKAALLGADGTVEQLAKAGRSYFGRDAALKQRLPALIDGVRALVVTRLDGELMRCRVQLLKAISGDPEDRDAVYESYGAESDVRSVLERAEDTVIAVMNVHLSTLLAALHVDQLGGKLFKTEGEELTRRYVVPATSLGELRSSAVLDELFHQNAGLSEAEVSDEVVTILGDAFELGLRLSQLGFATYDAGRLAPLVEVLDQRSQARFNQVVGTSVADVLEKLELDERERLVTEVGEASVPAIVLDESLLDPVADPLTRIDVVAAEKLEHAAYLKGGSFQVVEGSAERLAVQQAIFGFPLYAVRGIADLRDVYLRRDRLRSFPHAHRRFNERGVPDSMGAETLGVSDAVLLTFARARAVSEHVLAVPAILETIAGRFELARPWPTERPVLVDLVERDGRSALVLSMIEPSASSPSQFRLHSSLVLDLPADHFAVLFYGSSATNVANHQRFVDSLEVLEAELGARFVRDAYAAHLAQLDDATSKARAQGSARLMRALLATARVLRAHLTVLTGYPAE